MGEPASYALVCVVAAGVAALTLFSGFGLGTLLLPAFALFFSPEVAVAATAVVHLANNVFKVALTGRWAAWGVVLRFGAPSAAGALAGAWVLSSLSARPPLAEWALWGHACRVSPQGLTVGVLVVVFGLLELSGRLERVVVGPRWMTAGGVASGFFGGLSGHQGALRAAFLMRAGMSAQELVGTRAACAVVVDTVRLLVYGLTFLGPRSGELSGRAGLVGAACLAAFAGSAAGARLVKSVTIDAVRRITGAGLVALGCALVAGLI